MRSIIQNKKGYSMGGWTEGILFSTLIISLIVIVIGGMNVQYNKTNQIGIAGNETQQAFIDYQDTLDREIGGGEAEFSANQGLTLKSSWGIIKSVFNIVLGFITGNWITTIVSYMKLPPIVAIIFRVLYFVSLGFIVLKILFKVKA
jgi:hypothetical protein|tara:strand:+ start:4495 stop:4932 length:438 start_codon:yes stop_codon:yes gene_type:complete